MSVKGYWCEEHGFESNCTVDEHGERVCCKCDEYVSGITSNFRPPRNAQWSEFRFKVRYGYGDDDTKFVDALTVEEAVNKVTDSIPDDGAIRSVKVINAPRRFTRP